ncbi:BrnA antitoxin family protein [Polynucleobacter sp. MWH-Spelu-300-X4]|uniref:BrnA antitoxin family protein n=1 Tax=Polynucleobacter sp. MWH-Spelu-300-X4 TaxID=2689109 RepID=UPI001BFD02A0|nr:BrnA antitoxin family protein [Polynucleobacter sp. MWH-Spelu-300-X4]QWD79110.1 BrnA antitoxin family protein [Polynucleobacter sp. MWH-Spelu-300-X4]
MKKKLISLTSKEDLAITKSAKSDPDSHPLTDKEWHKVKPMLSRGRGRPLGSGTKEQVTLRIDRETLAFYKSKGSGWQTLINLILGEIKKESDSIKSIEKRMSQGNLICSRSKIAA